MIAPSEKIDRRAGGVIATAWMPLVAALVTLVAFLPSLGNDFVDWDDGKNLLENTHYRGLGWEQIKWAFTSFRNGHYMPLVWLSWGLDYCLWGMRPFGYHLSNLLIHAVNVVLVYLLAGRLLGRSRSPDAVHNRGLLNLRVCALLAALFFAVHPLRVESVVWATERKDLLSGFFYLLTVFLYLRHEGARWVLPAWVYVAAVLSKVMVVSLPVVLLVLDVYPLGRIGGARGWFGPGSRRVYLQKLPFVLLAAGAAVVAPFAQEHVGSFVTWEEHGLLPRLAACAYGLVFYAQKTFLPLNLTPLYELPRPLDPFDAVYLWCAGVSTASAAIIWTLRRRRPALAAAGICYVVILLPVLGLFQNGPQITGDRYSYLCCLGWVLLLCAGLFKLRNRSAFLQAGALALSGVVVIGLGTMSYAYSRHWRDTRSLWERALHVDPECAFCHNSMGLALAKDEPLEAETHYRQSLELTQGRFADPHNNLGILLTDQDRIPEALFHLEQALAIAPDSGVTLFNLGNALLRAGRVDDAIERYYQAARLPAWNPPSTVHNNLAHALIAGRRFGEAAEQARQAIRVDPANAKAHYNLGVALLQTGATEQAVESFQRSIESQPDEPPAYLHAARELADNGQVESAIQILRAGLARLPDELQLNRELRRLTNGG